jgi:hypothetical protein
VLDLLDRRKEALERDTGVTRRHDEYGVLINRQWVEKRLATPFERQMTGPE